MKNSKNFVRQISESYIQMKLDEERQPLQEMEWWKLLKKAGSSPGMYDNLDPNKPWSTNNFVGKRPWREGTKVRPTPGMGATPSQQAARQELETFRKGYGPRPTPAQTPQTPQAPRVPTTPTTTTRPGVPNLQSLPSPKFPAFRGGKLAGSLGALQLAWMFGQGLGEIVNTVVYPQGPKATPRPYQQDVLPSPESLYPAPSNAAGGGGGGGGGGLGGGMGGSGR
jgi:hypothetical protein